MPTTPTPASTRRLPAWVAPVADAVVLVAFVVAGRRSHGISAGAGWFFEILWPFALGWVVASLGWRLYLAPLRWGRWAATCATALLIAYALRAVAQDRAVFTAFLWVSAGFIVAFTAGWRLLALAVLGRRRAAAPAAAA